MRDSHYRITLDITKTQSQVSLSAKQGDTSRKIYISLVEGSQPYEIDGTKCTAVFHGVKSDGTKIEDFCIIEGNTIRYDFTQQTTAAVGLVECDITLHNTETGVIASPRFCIVVVDRAIEPQVVSEDKYFTVDALITRLGEVQTAEDTRQANEAARSAAETVRGLAEAGRTSAEKTRDTQEKTRKSNEEQRIENEGVRGDNETDRIANENLRNEAEAERQALWNNSVTNPNIWELEKGFYYVSGKVSITAEEYVTAPLSILYVGAYSNYKSFVLFTTLTNGTFNGIIMGTTNGTTADFRHVETTDNKVFSLDENSTDDQYPTAKAVFDALLAQAIDIKIEPIGDEAQPVSLAMEDIPAVASAMGITATNYITNGNFASSDGWSAIGSTLSIADNKATLVQTSLTNQIIKLSGTLDKDNFGAQRTGDVWFLKAHLSPDVTTPLPTNSIYPIMKININTAGGYLTSAEVKSASAEGERDVYGAVALSADAVASMSLIISFDYSGSNTILRSCEASNVVAVNLTEVYGAGNEPTADEFYALLSTTDDAWFDGTTTLYEGTGDSGESGGDDSGNENPGGSTDVVSGSGYKLIITTAEGTETLYLYQGQPGEDGKDGANGKDGVSPTITVKEIEGGNRLTITDKNGEQTVDILDGEQGGSNADAEVTNLVSNGNFVDTTGWSVLSGNTLSVEDNTAVLINDGSSGYIGMNTSISSAEGFEGHILFAKVYIEVEKYTNTVNQYKYPIIQIYNNSAGMSYAVKNEGQELEQDYYGTMTATIARGKSTGITWRVSYNGTATFASGKTCKFKNALIVDLTEVFGAGNEPTADEFYAMLNALDDKWFDGSVNLLDTSSQIKRISDNQIVDKDVVVTVGAGGDFATINKAMQYLSRYYPAYKKGGLNCEIRILDGTVIDEQIIVERADFSYISITSESADNTVIVTPTAVNWSKGTLTHDTRGNLPFFGGEFGARLPVIKCLFKLETGNENNTVSIEGKSYTLVGYYCNRGSMGVIAGHVDNNGVRDIVGFEGFNDNVIANNNSEIVLREAIARNAARYGVMARHISRVSARSADITGCADTAAYADRSSMMDVRFADVSRSYNGLQCFNTSNMTAVATIAKNITNIVADSREGSVINCAEMTIDNVKDVFKVLNGGTIIATSASPTNVSGTVHNTTINTLDAKGVIYG